MGTGPLGLGVLPNIIPGPRDEDVLAEWDRIDPEMAFEGSKLISALSGNSNDFTGIVDVPALKKDLRFHNRLSKKVELGIDRAARKAGRHK